jgi:hypothetical protein
MAVTGHQTFKEVERYTKSANQRRLVDHTAGMLSNIITTESPENANTFVQHADATRKPL